MLIVRASIQTTGLYFLDLEDISPPKRQQKKDNLRFKCVGVLQGITALACR